jgi:hypothetical protein
MRWVAHVAYIGDMKNAYKILVGVLKERYHIRDLGINEMILKWILQK